MLQSNLHLCVWQMLLSKDKKDCFSSSINRSMILNQSYCFVPQVCVRVASVPCLIGSGRSRRPTVRSWCVLTHTSCGTACTGCMRTVITGRASGTRWRCRWAGTGFPPVEWTLTFTCGTAKQTRSTSLKVFIYFIRVPKT